jgi:cation transporter-like permease
MRRRDKVGGKTAKAQRSKTLKRRNSSKAARRRSSAAATKNKATAFFTGATTAIGALQPDRLAKRGRDLIPVAILVVALFTLLALSVWFAAYGWTHLGGGEPVPSYGYVAIAGGVVVSLVVGVGLMALVFYSSRHGYDDLSGGDN